MKLRTKFFLIFSILALIPLCIITLFSYQYYESITYQRMDEFSENLFQNAVSEANMTLESISQSISFLTFYSNEGGYSIVETLKTFANTKEEYTSYDIFEANQYCNSVFQNLMVSNENINGIYLFTPTDVVFSCSNRQYSNLKTNYSPSDDLWYKETIDLEGQFYISTYTNPEMFTDKIDSIYIARSISDVYTHKFLGVILVDCTPQILNLDNVNIMPTITLLSISNKETNVVLYSNIDNLEKDFNNSTQKVKKADLAITPLILTTVFDYDALFDEYNLISVMLLSLALVCICSCLILTYFFTRTLIRPLEKLSSTMAEQNKHSLTFSSPYRNRTDEIGTLYNEYAQMLEALEASIKKDYKDKLIILDAQMKSLEARINSHFLFNTLESINSMAELDDNEQIATMSLALGNMFRYSIKTQSELVTLEEELQHVHDYVSIQQIRFSNRFRLIQEIPEGFLSQRVLKLILQPLVENALYHGLNYCTRGDEIRICVKSEEKTLYISVSDNGQGMVPATLTHLNQKLQEDVSFTELGHRNKQSIGLKNIHSRIELYYGKSYGLQLQSQEGKGTIITIRIPILESHISEIK